MVYKTIKKKRKIIQSVEPTGQVIKLAVHEVPDEYVTATSSASSSVKKEKLALACRMYSVRTTAGVKPANCG